MCTVCLFLLMVLCHSCSWWGYNLLLCGCIPWETLSVICQCREKCQNQTTADDGNRLPWLRVPALLVFPYHLVLYQMIPFFFSTGPISVSNVHNLGWSLNEQLLNISISPRSSTQHCAYFAAHFNLWFKCRVINFLMPFVWHQNASQTLMNF